jgi:hypothetical protein
MNAFGELLDAQRRGVVRLQPLESPGDEVALVSDRRELTQTPCLIARQQPVVDFALHQERTHTDGLRLVEQVREPFEGLQQPRRCAL